MRGIKIHFREFLYDFALKRGKPLGAFLETLAGFPEAPAKGRWRKPLKLKLLAVPINLKPQRYIIKELFFFCLLSFFGVFLCADEGIQNDGTAGFRGFPWGTSLEEFTAREGQPVARETIDGLISLAYENREMSGYRAYMLVYFSESGLEGGTYYFLNENLDEVMACYRDVQRDMVSQYGPGALMDQIIREMFPYESVWNLSGSYIHLKANTRTNEPVTLWFSSPALTKKILGTS